MKSNLILLQVLIVLLIMPLPARSALDAISTDGQGAPLLNLANGFPLWYRDNNGRKLELCLEQAKIRADTQTSFFPCLTAEPQLSRPISFPGNIGVEGFYWGAVASGSFTSSDGQLGDMLVVLAHEMSFPNLIVTDNQQMVFARIRLRINVPVPGTYRVIHPFGTRDYVVTATGAGREINQTQDVGTLSSLDFLASLNDAQPTSPSAPLLPAVSEGVINNTGASIGPYLGVAGGNPVLDTEGNLYLSNPGTDLVPILSPIEQGLSGVDFFEVELRDPPANFFLNAADSSQKVRLSGFQITGKYFNDGPNLPPTAVDNTATTQPGGVLLIDVVANDEDPAAIDLTDPFNPANPANFNVQGLNQEAILLLNGSTQLNRIEVLTTSLGATVRRIVDAPTGRAKFLYLPGAPGEDSFSYVIQDKGGLISQPAEVKVTVEDLVAQRAEFRPTTGKWLIEGSSSAKTGNAISIFSAPQALLKAENAVPPVTSGATGTLSLQISNDQISYQLAVDPLPESPVTAVEIHFGTPGEEGQALFSLYEGLFDGEFSGSLNGQLNAGTLFPDSSHDITNFASAIQAILDGKTYLKVTTSEHSTGELRGQLAPELIGTVPVAADGSWRFYGRSKVSPGRVQNLSITSAIGNQLLDIPVSFR